MAQQIYFMTCHHGNTENVISLSVFSKRGDSYEVVLSDCRPMKIATNSVSQKIWLNDTFIQNALKIMLKNEDWKVPAKHYIEFFSCLIRHLLHLFSFQSNTVYACRKLCRVWALSETRKRGMLQFWWILKYLSCTPLTLFIFAYYY